MQRKSREVVGFIPNSPKFQYHHRGTQPLIIEKPYQIQCIPFNNNISPSHYAHYPQFSIMKITQPQKITIHTSPSHIDQRYSLPHHSVTPNFNRSIQSSHSNTRCQNVNGFRTNAFIESANPYRAFVQNVSAESSHTINSPKNFAQQKRLQPNKMSQSSIKNIHTAHTSPIKLQLLSRTNLEDENPNTNYVQYQNKNFMQSPAVSHSKSPERVYKSIIIADNNLDRKLSASKTLKISINPNAFLNENPSNHIKQNSELFQSITIKNHQPISTKTQQGLMSHTTEMKIMKSKIFNRGNDKNIRGQNQMIAMSLEKKKFFPKSNLKLSSNIENVKHKKNQQIWKSAQLPINKNQSEAKLMKISNSKYFGSIFKKDEDSSSKKSVQRFKTQSKQKILKVQGFLSPYSRQQISPPNFKFARGNGLETISQNNNQAYLSQSSLVRHRHLTPRNFTIDDFQIIEKLGRGTYGDVFLARQRKSRFICVLKTLSKKRIKELRIQEHVFREIKIQSYLKHRHLTNLYGVFHDQCKIYLIMQCMPDGSLSSNGKKKISQSEIAYLLAQVCEGLLFMHRQDIIHRDIKPQNLILNNSYVKIADFGCAVFGNGLRRTVVGSYAYISPQQFSNNPHDEKIDSWCVGVLAYEMFTGKPPYEQRLRKMAELGSTNNNSQLKTKEYRIDIAKTMEFPEIEFPDSVKVSSEGMDFIRRLLDKDPARRADIKQALKHKFLLKARQYERYLESQLESKL